MKRLTFKEPCGRWGVVGMNAENECEKTYGCLCKLLDYEETGLEPAEIEKLICKVSSIKQIKTVAELICSKYENLFSRLEDMEENLQIIEKEFSQLKNISKGEA